MVAIQYIDDFELPTALAGGKGMNIKLALAKKNVILAKAIPYYP